MKLFTFLPLSSLLLVTSFIPSSYALPNPRGADKERLPRFNFNSIISEEKYFIEAGNGIDLGHYDKRYFQGLIDYDEHRATLQHLIRSYLTVFREELNIETWLAHGTLLGWWWNGRIMPWDADLDVQVSAEALSLLTKTGYNMTFHDYQYTSDDDEDGKGRKKQGSRRYLLDINPWSAERSRLLGLNVIDARWIDTSNGMFIDITGLAERDPDNMPGVWSCKNYHRYYTTDLYPLRETEFEGVPALVPYSFNRVLIDEYGTKSMVQTEFAGHHWVPGVKAWLKDLSPDASESVQPMMSS
ncbi:LicD family-domain-containing protein [Podospora didyma]|uniref:LicD family-domain-containing protein n=1 Tax=Podospora didyma TaxID=330526 RepID=A0AAE0NU18_9PEZI|nr:LicD family-domain-containing protein [Podospora didyma]